MQTYHIAYKMYPADLRGKILEWEHFLSRKPKKDFFSIEPKEEGVLIYQISIELSPATCVKTRKEYLHQNLTYII